MVKTALRMLDNPSLADDLIQDSFLLFLTRHEKLDEHTNITGWLVLTLRNKIANEMNRACHTCELPFPPGFEPAAEDSTYSSFMAAMPQGLKEEERQLLYLRLEAGFSHREIAARLGCSEDACKMRLYRARARCKNLLLSEKN